MAGVRSLSRRVQRLERGRDRRSPIVLMFGSFGEFETHCERAIEAGVLDVEFRACVVAMRRWETSGVWDETLRDHAFVVRRSVIR